MVCSAEEYGISVEVRSEAWTSQNHHSRACWVWPCRLADHLPHYCSHPGLGDPGRSSVASSNSSSVVQG
ncbi:hypothetical protein DMJ13_19145 [halophilic archaeon]|nr:hypothetical protein DMJ13_19145 [halophilic archaeon]